MKAEGDGDGDVREKNVLMEIVSHLFVYFVYFVTFSKKEG